MRRRQERRIGRGGIADLGVDHDIRQIVVEPWRVLGEARYALRHGRQRFIVDHDLFGGILGLRDRLGDDERDRGADMAHAIGRQDVVRRHRHRRAVAIVQHDVRRRAGRGEMRNALQSVGQRILPGEHRKHARHGARLRCIDRADACVGVRRAHHGRVGLAGKIEIVAVSAAPSDEPQIFLAADRVSDTCLHVANDVGLAKR